MNIAIVILSIIIWLVIGAFLQAMLFDYCIDSEKRWDIKIGCAVFWPLTFLLLVLKGFLSFIVRLFKS